jgi:hypothetical protein
MRGAEPRRRGETKRGDKQETVEPGQHGKLMKTNAGEVAESLKAAVC